MEGVIEYEIPQRIKTPGWVSMVDVFCTVLERVSIGGPLKEGALG